MVGWGHLLTATSDLLLHVCFLVVWRSRWYCRVVEGGCLLLFMFRWFLVLLGFLAFPHKLEPWAVVVACDVVMSEDVRVAALAGQKIVVVSCVVMVIFTAALS